MGLAASVALTPDLAACLLVSAGGALGLALTRPAGGTPAVAWIALVAVCAALGGLALGQARLSALAGEAFEAQAGAELRARGVVASTPRTGGGTLRFALETGSGRIGVEFADADATLLEGDGVVVTGRAHRLDEWERGLWERQGVVAVIAADGVRAGASGRDGLAGALDGVRNRARDALGRGTAEPAAALLRGFVLGEDDRIAEPVREDFRRSGLAHVLAVSGQNVMLLALLATPLLAALGLPLRARLLAVVALIAIYVPVAGAGPSIQRAGVMGAAGLAATLAGRPRSGWYALGLAAVVTLGLDPRATADIGWQLSFAAVAGLFALGRPLTRALLPTGVGTSRLRLALAEGAAITIAATVATAPLVAHHFGTLSVTALPANVAALPAVAPAMWLGMLAGALGQLPGAPVEPLTALGGLCAGYVAWVAHALGPTWAQLELRPPGVLATLAWTAGLVTAVRLACAWRLRRVGLRPRRALGGGRGAVMAGLLALGLVAAALAIWAPGASRPVRAPLLELRFLDVGQGDAILLRPRRADPVLVDTGPPGAAAERLEELGVDRLAAIVISHDQLDHSGGLAEIAGELAVGSVVVGPGHPPDACPRAAPCPPLERVAAGSTLRAGALRIDVLWPAAGARPAPGADPNASSLVLLARRGEFEALLTGDAEAEAGAYPTGPVELLKVAHHGSADAGLPRLLDLAAPAVAVISVGADNPYGHPAPPTLAALDEAGVPVHRTDEDGEVAILVRSDGWTVE